MPKRSKKVKRMRRPPSARGPRKSKPTSVGTAITRGLSSVADRFLPGAGYLVSGASKLLGFGAYTRESASTYLASKVPTMHATLDKGIRVSHHEYLGEMSSSTAYAVASYMINPGLSGTFPWLSTVAAAFQKWEDNGIVFYFKSTSADALNSTNTALGSVIGAVTYNPYQVPPTDKVSMLGLSGANAGKPSEDNLFPVECLASQSLFGTKLVRLRGVVDDLAKYDAGTFHIATVGSQAVAAIGELHVVYDITLKEPKLAPTSWMSAFTLVSPTSALPLGNAAANMVVNGLNAVVDNVNRTITIPKASLTRGSTYLLQWSANSDSGATTQPAITLQNATESAPFALTIPTPGTVTARSMCAHIITPTNLGLDVVVIYSTGTIPANTTGTLWVCETGPVS